MTGETQILEIQIRVERLEILALRCCVNRRERERERKEERFDNGDRGYGHVENVEKKWRKRLDDLVLTSLLSLLSGVARCPFETDAAESFILSTENHRDKVLLSGVRMRLLAFSATCVATFFFFLVSSRGENILERFPKDTVSKGCRGLRMSRGKHSKVLITDLKLQAASIECCCLKMLVKEYLCLHLWVLRYRECHTEWLIDNLKIAMSVQEYKWNRYFSEQSANF